VSPTSDKPRFWTGEAIVGAVGAVLVIGGALVGLTGHAYVLSDHVAQLERDRDATRTAHAQIQDRMRDLEKTVAANRAEADKRESLVEKGLSDINTKLDTLQSSVDQLQQHHH
jgi:chromosome segregation ATPase